MPDVVAVVCLHCATRYTAAGGPGRCCPACVAAGHDPKAVPCPACEAEVQSPPDRRWFAAGGPPATRGTVGGE